MADEETQEEGVEMQAPAPGGSKKKMIILILAAVVLLGVGVVVILLLTGGAKEDEVDIQALLDDIPVVEEVDEEDMEEGDVENKVFNGADLAFDYPADVVLVFTSAAYIYKYPSIYPLMTYNFIGESFGRNIGDKVFGPIGLYMEFGYQLSFALDGAATYEELLTEWSDVEIVDSDQVVGVVDVQIGVVDGRRFIRIDEILAGPPDVIGQDQSYLPRTRVYVEGLFPESNFATKITSDGSSNAEDALVIVLDTMDFGQDQNVEETK